MGLIRPLLNRGWKTPFRYLLCLLVSFSICLQFQSHRPLAGVLAGESMTLTAICLERTWGLYWTYELGWNDYLFGGLKAVGLVCLSLIAGILNSDWGSPFLVQRQKASL